MNLKKLTERIVDTRHGRRLLTVYAPTTEFWAEWKARKEALKRAGYSVELRDGEWRVLHWADVQAEVAASRAVDADITIPCPPGREYMPFQRAGIAYALARTNTLIADEPGLGKTVQAIGTLNALPAEARERVLIVVPAYLRYQWVAELKNWLTYETQIRVNGDIKSGEAGIYVLSYEGVTRAVRTRGDAAIPEFQITICDEAHYLKNPKAARTRAVLRGITSQRWIFLTGTPILQYPVELWPLLTHLDPYGLGANYYRFVRRYCDARRGDFGLIVHGASNTRELGELMRARFMIRRAKKDVWRELPPKIRRIVWIDPAESRGLERALAREQRIFAELIAAYGSLEEAMRQEWSGLEELAEARQASALAKVPQACEHIVGALEESRQIVVFAWHKAVARACYDYLLRHTVCLLITGDMTNGERQAKVEAFQRGEARVLVATIGAAGTGFTLTAADRVCFLEEAWQPGVVIQAEDRIHRISQNAEAVYAEHILAAGSVDEHIAKTLAGKSAVVGDVLDGGGAAMFAAE